VTRYSKAEVAKHKDTMDVWLKQRFQEKEERLRQFYANGQFSGQQVHTRQTNIPVAVAAGVSFHSALWVMTLAAWYYFPIASLLWCSCCLAVVVHRIQSFGD
jgi:hypothetical protein